MAVEKVSLSLDPELLAEARALAGRGGLSALVNEGLQLQLQQIRLTRLLDEMDEEFGPVPQHVTEEVAKQWRDRDQRSVD